jgi:hypothetical protein
MHNSTTNNSNAMTNHKLVFGVASANTLNVLPIKKLPNTTTNVW